MNTPAIFTGQTATRLVKGRNFYKVSNTYYPSTEHPMTEEAYEEYFGIREKERSELEQMYYEFCKKAHKFLVGHSSLQGMYMPEKIVFPDFKFEVVPQTIKVE